MKPICAVNGVLIPQPENPEVRVCEHIKKDGDECMHKGTCKHQLPDLHLNLKAGYFQQIRDDEKREEYRLNSDYWKKRLEGRCYGRIIIKKGYPKTGDTERTLIRKWDGYTIKQITHPHFGNGPVNVFAIDVSKKIEGIQ